MRLPHTSPVAVLTLCALATGCGYRRPVSVVRPKYPVHVTVLVFPVPAGPGTRGCAVASIPHSTQASIVEHDAVVWDVVDDACKAADFEVTSTDPGFGKYFDRPTSQPNELTGHLRKRAPLRAGASVKRGGEALKYTVVVKTAAGQTLTEDPEIVIWP